MPSSFFCTEAAEWSVAWWRVDHGSLRARFALAWPRLALDKDKD